MDRKSGVEHLHRAVREDFTDLVHGDVPGERQVGVPLLRPEELEGDPLPIKVSLEQVVGVPADLLIAMDLQIPGEPDPVHPTVLSDERAVGADHLCERVHKAGGVATGEHHPDPGIDEGSDALDRTGADPSALIGDRPVDVGDNGLQHGLRPPSSTIKGASPSGRFGLSTSRAIRFPPLLLRR